MQHKGGITPLDDREIESVAAADGWFDNWPDWWPLKRPIVLEPDDPYGPNP